VVVSAAPNLPQHSEWTVDDLDELPPDLPYELINGRLVVAPSAVPAHQDLAGELWLALRANCPPDYFVSTGQSLAVNRHNEPRPDVVAITIDNYGRSPIPVQDAILAVEVISPTSQFRDMVEKADIYASAGIATYWIVDQSREDIQLTEMVLDRKRRRYVLGGSTTGVFSVTEPWPITIDLPALSKRRAHLLERAARRDNAF
jgi:Uma2 family endonuclease